LGLKKKKKKKKKKKIVPLVVEFLTIVLNSDLAVEKVINLLSIGYLNVLPFLYVDVNILKFIYDLFILSANKVRNLSLLLSYSNILEYENFIKMYTYIFLSWWNFSFRCASIQYWGNGDILNEQLLKSSQESTIPYIVGLAEYLANTIPIISSSLELLFFFFFFFFLRDLTKTLSLPRVPTSYRYDKGIVKLVVLLILINIHLLTAPFRTQNI